MTRLERESSLVEIKKQKEREMSIIKALTTLGLTLGISCFIQFPPKDRATTEAPIVQVKQHSRRLKNLPKVTQLLRNRARSTGLFWATTSYSLDPRHCWLPLHLNPADVT